MIAAAKRLVPWLHGLLAYLAWRAGGLAWGRRARHLGQVNGPVCVIQVNSHGDVLMATPLLQALVEALGAGRVDVVVSTHTAPLLKCFPGLGKLIVMKSHLRWRRPTTLWGLVRVVRELRNRRYGAILDVSRLTQSAWMTFLARPQRGVGLRLLRRMGPVVVEQLGYLYTDEVEVRPDAHMIRQNLALLTPLGITASSERVRFTPDPSDVEAATGWLTERELGHGRPFVVIHPGAKWPPKRWHAERFRVLTGRLLSHGLAVVLAGDAADRPLLDAVAGEGTPSPLLFILAGDLQFSAVGALLREARLFIGNDSGLMHLAEAVGTPIVALFGPTFPDRTGPLGPTHRALVKPIPCRPCRLYFTRDRCERGHNYCMDMIDVDEVWASTHALLDQETKSCPA